MQNYASLFITITPSLTYNNTMNLFIFIHKAFNFVVIIWNGLKLNRNILKVISTI